MPGPTYYFFSNSVLFPGGTASPSRAQPQIRKKKRKAASSSDQKRQKSEHRESRFLGRDEAAYLRGGAYNKILNPATENFVDITSRVGQQLLNNYINVLNN